MVLFAAGFFVNAGIVRIDVSPVGVISRSPRPSMSNFWQVFDILHQKYDGTIDNNKLVEGAIRGEVSSLNDPYTVYFNADEAKKLQDELSGNLSGIGIEIGVKNNKLTVISPIDGTPAANAGLQSGDVIAAINGVSSSSYTLDEAVNKIRGQAGTKVKLTITRGITNQEIEITRAKITVPSVTYEIKENNIGYIKIREFGDGTTAAVKAAALEFKAANVRGVVMDLRNNPGGYLQSAVDVVSQFQASGVVVIEKGKSAEDNKTYNVSGDGSLTKVPLVILINDGSASASEITAGALHDNGRAVLIGEKTFGKGVVQQVIDLGGGRQLKVTVAKWYTPKGTNISKAGIKADIEVKNTEANFANGTDPQLERALQEVQTKSVSN